MDRVSALTERGYKADACVFAAARANACPPGRADPGAFKEM
jgi:hypothetical protein